MHIADIRKPHLEFGRVDVHVEFGGRQRDCNRVGRMHPGRQQLRVGRTDGVLQLTVTHGPTVHGQNLQISPIACSFGRREQAFDMHRA